MSQLVHIESGDRPAKHSPRGSRLRVLVIHGLRLSMFAGVILCLYLNHRHSRAPSSQQPAWNASDIEDLLPRAARVGEMNAAGVAAVRDNDGVQLGTLMQTSPDSDPVIGFSGATNTWIAFDTNQRIVGLKIVQSEDTWDHVRDVKRDPSFLASLNGKSADEALAAAGHIDSVSGATLTSLAIMEGVLRRLERSDGASPSQSTPRSLRFPQTIALPEVQATIPGAERLQPRQQFPRIMDVFSADGEQLGAVIRTAPAGDEIIGYQGPTDSLLVLNAQDEFQRIIVRHSYDNEPYVGYVREDSYFAELLAGRALESLPNLDYVEAEVEGVSGATMTSIAMMDAMRAAAQAALVVVEAKPPVVKTQRSRWRIQARDWGTVAVLLGALLLAFSRLRGNPWVRFGFQLILVGYLGFLNGDMLSQAQLIGWAKNGVPWQFAPGLALLTLAAIAAPIFTKRQVYCQQICPFGAAQQVAGPGAKRISLGRAARWLRTIPFLLLLFSILVGLFAWPVELAGLEPFDAFLFGAAASMVLAVVSLLISARIPMAYCRYGCPTGAMLDYIRLHPRADRLDWRDGAMASMLVLGMFLLSRGGA